MNQIKNLRQAHIPKMSQEKLGLLVGVGRSTVAMWECGKSEPDNATLLRLSEIFNVSTDFILGRTDSGETPGLENEQAITEDDLKVAYFRGADPTLTQEDMDALWEDAKNFRDFIVERRKKERNGG